MTKKLNSDIITFKGIPSDHSYQAYKDGYYFEAIVVLHGHIEGEMKSLFHMYSLNKCKESIPKNWFAETYDANDRLSFIMIAHVLFVVSLITKNEYDVLVGFNTLRNTMMHRFYSAPYEGMNKGVSKKKFHSCIKSADRVLCKISERAENLYDEVNSNSK
ncbi:hypothetical protein SAMN05421636_10811 [Pricia antarctica]|uniref:Uncharacterized protein n=1 Tax=Pricia antarctica TaxID=641691 RepID=A0A1G7G821_9FLAO|nr:hypothetical protein [Pricia antarctica]SDE84253.1 hypothetical protein SAMN05421636_10811 [Pricia antarctica]